MKIEFIDCMIYLATTGIGSFFLGRILPKRWFQHTRFPYKDYAFEQRGGIYDRIGVRRWKDKIPDMSRILPGLLPSKCLLGKNVPSISRMLQETCVAEFIHALLCVTGLYCGRIWPGIGGRILAALNLAGNALYIIIQRYNRPRLAALEMRRLQRG